MKKKTALALSTTALLSAGLLFGAKFYNQKKERDEFEEHLKTVLVPDAEKKLDDLLRQDAALNDSVVKFEEALKLLEQQEDSVHAITGLMPFEEIRDMGNVLRYEWLGEVNRIFYDEFGDTQAESEGNWLGSDFYERKDKKAIELFKKVFYLTGNESHMHPLVPVHDAKFMLRDSLPVPAHFHKRGRNFDAYDVAYSGIDVDTTKDLARFFEDMSEATGSIRGDVEDETMHSPGIVYENSSVELRLQVLKSWQAFLKSIDNSQKVFSQKTLEALDKKVKELMPIVEKEYQLSEQWSAKRKKQYQFEKAATTVGKQIDQQKAKITRLKTTPIEDLMPEQHGK